MPTKNTPSKRASRARRAAMQASVSMPLVVAAACGDVWPFPDLEARPRFSVIPGGRGHGFARPARTQAERFRGFARGMFAAYPRGHAMRLVVLVVVLLLGSVGAGVRDASAQAPGQVEVASAAVVKAEQARAAIVIERGIVAKRYESELAEIDKLKRQKASWRRDRALRAQM